MEKPHTCVICGVEGTSPYPKKYCKPCAKRTVEARKRAKVWGAYVYDLPNDYRELVFADSNGICVKPGCDEPATQVDHKLAISCLGLDIMSNLQGMCSYHNISKKNKYYADYTSPEVLQKWFNYDLVQIGQLLSQNGYL